MHAKELAVAPDMILEMIDSFYITLMLQLLFNLTLSWFFGFSITTITVRVHVYVYVHVHVSYTSKNVVSGGSF